MVNINDKLIKTMINNGVQEYDWSKIEDRMIQARTPLGFSIMKVIIDSEPKDRS